MVSSCIEAMEYLGIVIKSGGSGGADSPRRYRLALSQMAEDSNEPALTQSEESLKAMTDTHTADVMASGSSSATS